jgi:hypothetical protein
MLVEKYPFIAGILSVLGLVRLLMKPIMTVIDTYVAWTPSESDNLFWKSFQDSKIFKGFCFIIDWLFSVKLVK